MRFTKRLQIFIRNLFCPFSNDERKGKNTYHVVYCTYLDNPRHWWFFSRMFIHLKAKQPFLNMNMKPLLWRTFCTWGKAKFVKKVDFISCRAGEIVVFYFWQPGRENAVLFKAVSPRAFTRWGVFKARSSTFSKFYVHQQMIQTMFVPMCQGSCVDVMKLGILPSPSRPVPGSLCQGNWYSLDFTQGTSAVFFSFPSCVPASSAFLF